MRPSIAALFVTRSVIALCAAIMYANPLIPDYIKPSSRGRAYILHAIGTGGGEMVAMVLLSVLQSWNYTNQYLLVGSISAFYGLLTFLWMREPKIKLVRPDRNLSNLDGENFTS
jgi:MFS family permease